jgi:HAD superfamily hydrolase (TIGR01509 family)
MKSGGQGKNRPARPRRGGGGQGASPFRAVVFDLDGTLLDSMTLVLQAIAEAIEPYAQLSQAEIFAKLGGPPERFMAGLLKDPAHIPLALARLNTRYNDAWRKVRPYAGIVDQLASLHARQVKLALWTGRDRESGAWLLREHRLDGYFDTVVYGDDLPSHKPDPEGLHEIMRRLAVAADETLFVGDADVDVLGGLAAGVETLLIHHDRPIAEDITTKSWQNVATPREALELVLRSL